MSESEDEDLPQVEVLWYPDGEIKVIVKAASPLAIEQFYRNDKQTIVKLAVR